MANKIKATIVTGFLEAGKTSYINSCLLNVKKSEQFPLIISTEQGEVDYSDISDKCNIVYIDNIEDLNKDTLNKLTIQYPSTELFVEVNGMFDTTQVLTNIPDNWYLNDVVAIFDANTFISMLNNYGKLISDKIKKASLILFNRGNEETIKQIRNKDIRALNPSTNIFFQVDDKLLPYYDGSFRVSTDDNNTMTIKDGQYLLWYTDSLSNPENYIGKKLKICGFLRDSSSMDEGILVIERDYIYCCKDDMLFLNIYCYGNSELPIDSWVEIEGTIIKNDNPSIDKPYYIKLDSIQQKPEIIDSIIY